MSFAAVVVALVGVDCPEELALSSLPLLMTMKGLSARIKLGKTAVKHAFKMAHLE